MTTPRPKMPTPFEGGNGDDEKRPRSFWDHFFIVAVVGALALCGGMILADSVLHGSSNEVFLAVRVAITLGVIVGGSFLFRWLRKR